MSFLATARYANLVGQLAKVPDWSHEKLLRIQRNRLAKIVQFASSSSPFYKKRFSGIKLSALQLRDLPPVSKSELQAGADSIYTDPMLKHADLERWVRDDRNLGRWYLGKYCVSHTSGSQGTPLFIVQDRSTLELLFGVAASRASIPRNPGLLEAIYRLRVPRKVAVVTFKPGFYPSGSALEFMPQIAGRFVDVRKFSSVQPDLIEQLRNFQPNALFSYASVLDLLSFEANELKFEHLKQITNSSEQLTDAARKRIEAAFEVPVIDHYGAGECLWMADSCPDGHGLHIQADWVIVENVDSQLQPVADGQLGDKILVTNLKNRTQPFIRYAIEDRVILRQGPCLCGAPFPRFERIQGRAVDAFVMRDGNTKQFVTGVVFHSASDTLNRFRDWQAIQRSERAIELRVELLPEVRESQADLQVALRNVLREVGLPDYIQVDLLIKPRIEPDSKTGKVRRMIRLEQAG